MQNRISRFFWIPANNSENGQINRQFLYMKTLFTNNQRRQGQIQPNQTSHLQII